MIGLLEPNQNLSLLKQGSVIHKLLVMTYYYKNLSLVSVPFQSLQACAFNDQCRGIVLFKGYSWFNFFSRGLIWWMKDLLHLSLVTEQTTSTLWGASSIRASRTHFHLKYIYSAKNCMFSPLIFLNISNFKQNQESNPHTIWNQINIIVSAFIANHIHDSIETLEMTNSHSRWVFIQYCATKA